MRYRTLGKTGLKISEIGYGTWQFANDENCWTGATREESERSLLLAIDNGLNFIDTARVYGNGLSEQWIGEIIKKRPQADLVIASKIMPKNYEWPARIGVDIQEVFPKEHITRQVDGSLKALDIDALDLMQFHVWQDAWAEEDEWKETIQELTRRGKVKNWGISINDYEPSNCLKTLECGLFGSIQTIFNIFHQRPVRELFPFARENDIGIIARVPLDEGGLTGKIVAETDFEDGDFRANYLTKERKIELEKRIEKLKNFLDEDIQSISELALRFILSFNAVSSVIPGMRKTEHVRENTTLSDKGSLSDEIMQELAKHSWERNFYKGAW